MEHSLSEFQASSAAMISGVGGGRGGGWGGHSKLYTQALPSRDRGRARKSVRMLLAYPPRYFKVSTSLGNRSF